MIFALAKAIPKILRALDLNPKSMPPVAVYTGKAIHVLMFVVVP